MLSRQIEGPHRELLVLSRERQVLVLQIEALRAEAQQAERDLQNQHLRHQTELQCLRDESLQVRSRFRAICHILMQQVWKNPAVSRIIRRPNWFYSQVTCSITKFKSLMFNYFKQR